MEMALQSDPESMSIVQTVNEIVAKSEQEMMNLIEKREEDNRSLIDSEYYPASRMIRTKLVAISRPKLMDRKDWDRSPPSDDQSFASYRKYRRSERRMQDEHEFREQMNFINAEWEKPEVEEVIRDVKEKKITFTEASKRITSLLGREITIASVRNRAYRDAELRWDTFPFLGKHIEDEGNVEQTVGNHPLATKEFGPGIYEVIRNIRGNLNNIAIKEPGSNNVRIYRRSTARFSYSYYRCSACDHLSKYAIRNVFTSPIIKMVNDRIVGEPFPPHHPNCRPISLENLRAMQIDREYRQQVIDELRPPLEAWSKGELRALLEKAQTLSQDPSPERSKEQTKYEPRHPRKRQLSSKKPVGETLASFEEKLRRELKTWRRPDFRAGSADSGQSGSQTQAYSEERSLQRQKSPESEVRTVISDESDVLDEDGLLPEEREQIEQLKAQGYVVLEGKREKADSSVPKNVSETGEDRPGPSGITSGIQTSVMEPETEPHMDTASVRSESPETSWSSEYPKYGPRPFVIKETNRRFFLVADDHLLKLFRRCPNCAGDVGTLVLTSRDLTPVIKYECLNGCGTRLWIGSELRR